MSLQTERGPNPWLQGLQPVQSQQDIQSLIKAEVPEGERLEYKRNLSFPKGGSDTWESGRKLNAEAKKKILQEVVAFANAYGGTLLLGIAESEAKPPVAQQIHALPDCADLAERWHLVFRDCVEPPLLQLQIYPVPTTGDEGVVVFQVGRSAMAPHRVTLTRDCPIRRADRCEPMTMREIQDMSVNTARGLERLERQLESRSQRFRDREIPSLENPGECIGVRLTAAPVIDAVSIDPVYHNNTIVETLAPQDWRVQWQWGDEDGFLPSCDVSRSWHWRPMLRAARGDWSGTLSQPYRMNLYGELHCDGLVELGYVSSEPGYVSIQPELVEYELITWICNLLAWTDQVRSQAQASMSEYVLEVEIMTIGCSGKLAAGFQQTPYRGPGLLSLLPGAQKFPPYPFRHSDDIGRLAALFRRDLWHWIGKDLPFEATFSLAD